MSLIEQLTGRLPDTTVNIITLGAGLRKGSDSQVAEAVAMAMDKQADVRMVASPTDKATHTGVFMAFLHQFGARLFDGALSFPFVFGAGLRPALVPELVCKPVLLEIGGTYPVRGRSLLSTIITLTGKEPSLHTARRPAPGKYASAACRPPVTERRSS